MDENKENNTPEYIKAIQASEKIQKSVTVFGWLNDINKLQKITASVQKSYEVFDFIVKELAQRNINTEVIGELELSEILKLYKLSSKTGLTFADLAQDSLNMFGEVKCDQAVAYLESLNSRKKQILKNDFQNFIVEDNLIEDIEYIEENAGYYIKVKLEEYKRGEIVLTEQEKKLLAAIKKNKLLTNAELADMYGYSVRNIEEICRKIREKFEIDAVENKLKKRILLITLAKYITI